MSRLLLLVACLTVLPLMSRADWTVSRGDAQMTGVGSATLPDQLAERWVFQCKDTVESAPAIVNGIAYISSLDKHLYAVDLATGQLKWKTQLGLMTASPAFHGGRLYIGDLEGKFHCVDAANGKKIWSFEAGGEIHACANFYKETIIFGCHDATLYSLKMDGTKNWDLKIDGPINGAAAIVGDRTYVSGCSDGILYTVDLNTGKSLSTIDLAGRQSVATPAIADEKIFLSMVTNQVISVSLKTGKLEWEFEAAKRQQPFYSSAAVTDKYIIAGSRDRKVYALDRATGKEVWNFVTDGMVDASPVVVGNKVYVGCLSNLGEFYVLDLATGKQIQQIALNSAVKGSVAVGPDCILVGTEKGAVYCLGKKS